MSDNIRQGGSSNNNMMSTDLEDAAAFIKEYGLSEMFLYEKLLKSSIEDSEKVSTTPVSTAATVVSTTEVKGELVVELEGGAGVDQPEERPRRRPTTRLVKSLMSDDDEDEPREILRKRARNLAKPKRKEILVNRRKMNKLQLDIPNFKNIKKQVKKVKKVTTPTGPAGNGGGETSNVNVLIPDAGDYYPLMPIQADQSISDVLNPIGPDPEDLEMIENMMYYMNTSPQAAYFNPFDAINREYYSSMMSSTFMAAPSPAYHHEVPFGMMDNSFMPFPESQAPLPPPPSPMMTSFSTEPTPPPLSPPLPPPSIIGYKYY